MASDADDPLSFVQTMVLQGAIPIVVVGVLVPVGLVALFLALDAAPLARAVEHGELFLAAANSAFTGCVSLVAARRDKVLNATIASFVVLLMIVLPCYAAWAFLTVEELQGRQYSHALAVVGGGGMTIAAVIVALSFVALTYSKPAPRQGRSS